MSEHYVEVHVNVEPFDDDPDRVRDAEWHAQKLGFRRGKLLMDKGHAAPDAFFTWRGYSLDVAEEATRYFVVDLELVGVKVLRYKLELTLVDSRESDRWELLEPCGVWVEDKFSRATCVRVPKGHHGKHRTKDRWEWE